MKQKLFILLLGLLTCLGLAGCGEQNLVTTPDAMCAYTVGNGNQQGGNRTVNKVVGPGTSTDYNVDYDMLRYFPCGPRNYIVAANSEDKFGNVLLTGRTKDGVAVNVSASIYWMPNLSKEGVQDFIVLCQKYQCAADNLGVGDSNSSSKEWQNMLGENMHPTLQRVASAGLPIIDGSAWRTNDPSQRETLATSMSEKFAAELQKTTGFTEDVFCGSGSKGWGETFDCQQVRIVVDWVSPADGSLNQSVEAAEKRSQEIAIRAAQAQADIDQTNKIYGQYGEEYRLCRDLGSACKLILSPGGGVQVVQAP